MIELGRKQELMIVRKVDFGVYLAASQEEADTDAVLLPKKQVPEDAKEGDTISVFLYRDSMDRPIATVNEPKIMMDQVALLEVKEVSKIGAFLDWGLEKDLLLPFREQTKKVEAQDECLVSLYLDKSQRLCATMKVYPYLKTQSPYQIGDMVEGRIYEISDQFGVFVAVDDCYSGLIPKKEAQGKYEIGSKMQLRVTQVKEDGKLDLSPRQKAYMQLDEDGEQILALIDEDYGGVLPFDDKADPEQIKEIFGLSKNAFKRAVGHLYKEHQVEIKDGKIYDIRQGRNA